MSIGIWQLVLILAIIILIFGAGKIPRLFGDLGKGIKNFKKEIKSPADSEETEESKK